MQRSGLASSHKKQSWNRAREWKSHVGGELRKVGQVERGIGLSAIGKEGRASASLCVSWETSRGSRAEDSHRRLGFNRITLCSCKRARWESRVARGCCYFRQEACAKMWGVEIVRRGHTIWTGDMREEKRMWWLRGFGLSHEEDGVAINLTGKTPRQWTGLAMEWMNMFRFGTLMAKCQLNIQVAVLGGKLDTYKYE